MTSVILYIDWTFYQTLSTEPELQNFSVVQALLLGNEAGCTPIDMLEFGAHDVNGLLSRCCYPRMICARCFPSMVGRSSTWER